MSLYEKNRIIVDNLAIDIDLSNSQSWNPNNGIVLYSKAKWNNTIVFDAILPDFGLTAFDNGRVSDINQSLTIIQSDDKFEMHRIGYNTPTGGTFYDGYEIIPITGSSVGNYLNLNGGYTQGFFKLYNYDYEQLPARFIKGITIETLVEILPQSKGIFYYMGTRAEDKYNPYLPSEAEITGTTEYAIGGNVTGDSYTYSGRTTSEGNYLVSNVKTDKILSGFANPEDYYVEIDESYNQIDNVGNNVIAFFTTYDYRLGYKYVDSNGMIISNISPNQLTKIGWTLIDIVFEPYSDLKYYDSDSYSCDKTRTGDLIFYINGRLFWKIENFNEFYFFELLNDREKQIGVPFNISWGGGSFGLKHSYHFSGDTLVKDTRKDNLLIEKYFNDSFIGNVQKLRIYDNALSSKEILNNCIVEAKSNTNYNIIVSSGGRLIQKTDLTTFIPQQSSGSDIRKSIKYRNSDGTYKDLEQMIEIMVIVKSRSNPSIELVKFKKSPEDNWIRLIFINNYTYDFIVPDEITSLHQNEILFAEIKFQWIENNDIDNIFDKIFVVNITSNNLIDNSVKNY